ncbi:MAG: hypothetical protein J5676_03900 [Bacteroidaceae bacterium]|nr:hypothetical protein [Bacteroidaceae bacterium]
MEYSCDSYNEFAIDTISEYLRIADYCINTPKKEEDSCYGMPAFLLLSSVIDIIGTFYRNSSFEPITGYDVKNNKLGNAKDHFKQFYNLFLSPNLSQTSTLDEKNFIDFFYQFARCRATHNGVLAPRVRIMKSDKCNNFIEMDSNRRDMCIQLRDLCSFVRKTFEEKVEQEYDNYKKKNPSQSPATVLPPASITGTT